MGKIAAGRVIIAGLVAGFLWWVLEGLVQGVVLGADWNAAFLALGRTKEQMDAGSGRFMALVTVWCAIVGILGVWLYAAIRPRFGPGPKTALIAGVALWSIGFLLPAIIHYGYALWPTKLTFIPLTTGFFEAIITALVGGWLYKEA